MKTLMLFILIRAMENLQACDITARILQNLDMDGFHRNLIYEIDITVHSYEDVSPETWPYKDCVIGLYQLLPPGVYANSDELNQLKRSHNVNAVTNNTDVELPAEQSKPSYIFITHTAISASWTTWVPLHARYQKATKSEKYMSNEIEKPQLHMHCVDHRLDRCKESLNSAELMCINSSDKTCKWKELTYSMVSPSPIIWHIPVGDLNHYLPVAIVTAVIIVMGSLYLIRSIQRYKYDKEA